MLLPVPPNGSYPLLHFRVMYTQGSPSRRGVYTGVYIWESMFLYISLILKKHRRKGTMDLDLL